MKHLALLVACGLVFYLSASAQFTPQQYPFPYNPDSNQDGMVSMTDFLEILGLFGQEYPNSFYSDSTKAVLDLGAMGASQCFLQAESAGLDWRMLTLEDCYSFAPLIARGAPYDPADPTSTTEYWAWWSMRNHAIEGLIYTFNYEPSSSDYFANSDSTFFVSFRPDPYDESSLMVNDSRKCFLVTEVRPTFLYQPMPPEEEIQDLLNDGWLPLGGLNGFWKEAE